MKTPKKYTDNLKNNVITRDMLIDCLFSVNKRAKNCRDKERNYRAYFRKHRYVTDKYNSVETYQQKKEEYYNHKEKLLALVKPTCIHEESTTRNRRIYEYEEEYPEYLWNDVWCYEGFCYDKEKEKTVAYVDVPEPAKAYYLFYDMGEFSFHTPIKEEQLSSFEGLKINKIGQLKTKGKEIGELISVQFVKKVIEIIESGAFTYVDEQYSLEYDLSA